MSTEILIHISFTSNIFQNKCYSLVNGGSFILFEVLLSIRVVQKVRNSSVVVV